MKIIFFISFIFSLNQFAIVNTYQSMLDSYENETINFVRKKVVNDNYKCQKYSLYEDMVEVNSILRLKKLGRYDILITYPNTNLNNQKIIQTDGKTFSNNEVSLRKLGFGKLFLRLSEEIYYCEFSSVNDDWWID